MYSDEPPAKRARTAGEFDLWGDDRDGSEQRALALQARRLETRAAQQPMREVIEPTPLGHSQFGSISPTEKCLLESEPYLKKMQTICHVIAQFVAAVANKYSNQLANKMRPMDGKLEVEVRIGRLNLSDHFDSSVCRSRTRARARARAPRLPTSLATRHRVC